MFHSDSNLCGRAITQSQNSAVKKVQLRCAPEQPVREREKAHISQDFASRRLNQGFFFVSFTIKMTVTSGSY